MLTENFGFRLSPQDKTLLGLVAAKEERTSADVLRRLIRQAARDQEADSGNARDACAEEVQHG